MTAGSYASDRAPGAFEDYPVPSRSRFATRQAAVFVFTPYRAMVPTDMEMPGAAAAATFIEAAHHGLGGS